MGSRGLNFRGRRPAAIVLLAALLAGGRGAASNLTGAGPLTDRVVVLHFDDGHVDYHGRGESSNDDRAVADPLDTARAAETTSYVIRSVDDIGYEQGFEPLEVGRKSKGMDWSRKCEWDGKRCDNAVVFEHWIYLRLPRPLQTGKKYTLEMRGINSNRPAAAFTFSEYRSVSEAVHVNHLGYLPGARRKFAYVSHWMGDMGPLDLDGYDGNSFHVIALPHGVIKTTGKMKLRKDLEQGGPDTGQEGEGSRNFTGADVWECDFSEVTEPGEYFIAVEGVGRSLAFRIGPDVYREAFRATCRGLFHERAGIELSKEHTDWPRPRDHHPDDGVKMLYTKRRVMDADRAEGKENDELVKEQVAGPIRTWGWYHDAGDWDGYPSHAIIPRYLLTVYELKPGNFSDGELNLPESGNGIPDIVDEASWLIRYMRRTRGPTGGVAGARVHAIGGGNEDGTPSWEDKRTWYVYGEEPKATFVYASLAAQLAHCLKIAGKGRPGEWLEEAGTAYRWAEANTLPGDEGKVKEARMAAAVWLYRTLGGEDYHRRFRDDCADFRFSPDASNPGDAQWAAWAYILANGEADPDLKGRLKREAVKWADELNVATAEKRSFRAGWHWFVPTVIGFNTTPHVIESVVAYELTGEKKYLDAVQTTCDYMLGGNGLNMCWVSGLGHRYPRLFLHIDSWYDGKEEQIPGIVPYAVNAPKPPVSAWVGPWDTNMVWDKGVYPSWERWPLHEGYVDNRYCVMGNEFTVHQNVAPAAAVYGYLCGERRKR